MKAYKNILAAVVGCITGVVVISICEMLLGFLFPFPAHIDAYNKEVIAKAMFLMPPVALALLLLVYAIASFSGGLVATLISGKTKATPALSVGIVLTIAGVNNTIVLPHPVWFNIINVGMYLPFAYLGYRVLKQKSAVITS